MKEKEETKEYDFEATLVFLVKGKKVWLAPKRAKIGKKRLNGPGGGIELKDSSIKACAKREVREEFHVHIKEEDLQQCAIGFFTNIKSDGKLFVCKVHIFLVHHWIGIPKKSKEMGKPRLFSIYKMPFEKMMAADRFWIPEIFKGKKIVVNATLKNNQSEFIGKVEIINVKSFE